MNNLYFLSYNNYFNRIVKKEDVIEDYLPYAVGDSLTAINFNPADGVETAQVVNADYEFEGSPDYCVVTDAALNIVSRWFVIEVSRLRNRQYNVTLKRDVLADSYDAVLNADSFIVKGTLDTTDPLIFNSENATVNQIKIDEYPLKDRTGMPWIVGYISPDVALHGAVKPDGSQPGTAPAIEGTIEGFISGEYPDWNDLVPGYKYKDKNIFSYEDIYVDAQVSILSQTNSHLQLKIIGASQLKIFYYTPWEGGPAAKSPASAINYAQRWEGIELERRKLLIQNSLAANDQIETAKRVSALKALDNKIIKVAGSYYQIQVKAHDFKNYWPKQIKEYDKIFDQIFRNYYVPAANQFGGTFYTIEYSPYTVEVNTTTFTYDFANKNIANETSPYGILCMPYKDQVGDNLSAKSRLKIMQALGGISGLLYDIQILPYCPITTLQMSQGKLVDIDPNAVTVPVKVKDTQTVLTYIRVSKTPSFSFSIPLDIYVNDVKLDNETEMVRLTSPNYSGSFDFTPAKFYEGNNIVIDRFNVDCCYRPYTPYIHVAPEWSGLYGKNFNDARGLICSGDFSVDRISDQWETYQYNNKNFEKQFDRQIDSLELQNKWNLAGGIINNIGNTMMTSALLGGVTGNIGMAGLGVATGLLQGGFNIAEQQSLYRDQVDAMKDQHAWDLQNIQARPYGLTKVGALNQNNKFFPFLEFYSCTAEERNAIKDKLNYQGMTVNKMGKIKDFINKGYKNYVQATLVRLTGLKEDSHYVNEINNQLAGGVYYAD